MEEEEMEEEKCTGWFDWLALKSLLVPACCINENHITDEMRVDGNEITTMAVRMMQRLVNMNDSNEA